MSSPRQGRANTREVVVVEDWTVVLVVVVEVLATDVVTCAFVFGRWLGEPAHAVNNTIATTAKRFTRRSTWPAGGGR
jgi:hypothetical protein